MQPHCRVCAQGDHDSEVRILRYLLSQTSFRRGKRGDWYDRLALVLMNHPLGAEKALSSPGGVKEEFKGKKKERKEKFVRERKEEALKVCEAGLADPYTHLSESGSPSSPAYGTRQLAVLISDGSISRSLQVLPPTPHQPH